MAERKFPSREKEKKKDIIYLYQDDLGRDAYEVVRSWPKRFWVRHKDSKGRYVKGAPARSFPYHLPELLDAAKAPCVVIVEGEKDVETLRAHGFTATTGRGGANNVAQWSKWSEYFDGLAVVCLPDNDEPGGDYMRKVTAAIYPPARACVTVELPGLAPKGDVTDWLATPGNTPAKLTDLITAAFEDSAWKDMPAAAGAAEYVRGDAWEPVQPDQGEDVDDDDHGWEPMPLDALPPVIARFSEAAARALPCDPSLVALPALVCAAGAVGNSRMIQIKGSWKEPSILWAAGIAEPSSLKSVAYRTAVNALSALDAEWAREAKDARAAYEDELAVWDGRQRKGGRGDGAELADRKPRPPVARKLIVGDITVETVVRELQRSPRGLSLLRDELSGWFGGMGRYSKEGASSAEVSCWTECYEGHIYRYDRSTGDGTSVVIPRCSVSIYGTIQMEVLQRCMTRSLYDCGLAYRFLLVAPPEVPGRWNDEIISFAMQDQYGALLRALTELDRFGTLSADWEPKLVTWDADGYKRWVAYHDAVQGQMERSQGDRKRLLAKAKAWGARLALVLHLCDRVTDERAAPTVTAQQMDRAARLATWFARETDRVYSIIHSEPSAIVRQRLIDWLRRQAAPVTARQVRDSSRTLYPDTRRARLALDLLAADGLGCWRQRAAGAKGGRPTDEFSLYPPKTPKPQNLETP